MTRNDPTDPKGLIAEAYRIEGITEAECKSIFLDWALTVPDGTDTRTVLTTLLDRHGVEGHTMTAVVRHGLAGPVTPRRRGGYRARPRDPSQ